MARASAMATWHGARSFDTSRCRNRQLHVLEGRKGRRPGTHPIVDDRGDRANVGPDGDALTRRYMESHRNRSLPV